MLPVQFAYLLSEDGFSLTTKTLLFTIVTSSTLRGMSLFALLILRHFMILVYLAFLAEGTSLLRYVNLYVARKHTEIKYHNMNNIDNAINLRDTISWYNLQSYAKLVQPSRFDGLKYVLHLLFRGYVREVISPHVTIVH